MDGLITFLDDADFSPYKDNVLFARLTSGVGWPRTRKDYFRLVGGIGIATAVLMLVLAVLSIDAFFIVWLVSMVGLMRLIVLGFPYALAIFSVRLVRRETADEKHQLLRLTELAGSDMFEAFYAGMLYRFRRWVGGVIGFYGGALLAMVLVILVETADSGGTGVGIVAIKCWVLLKL